MISLQQALEQIGATQLTVLDFSSTTWQLFEKNNAKLFAKIQQVKPETDVHHHLLGVLTKAHIEVLSQIEADKDSVRAMNSTFKQELGESHAAKFQYQDGQLLLLITHIWIYLQGYLAMDFSLANDHAENSATMLVSIQGGSAEQLRSEFMASFYLARGQKTQFTNPILCWLKKIFQ